MMSDLISRSALAKAMGVENAVKYGNETAEQQHNSYDTLMKYEIADYIEDAPAVDAVPRWIPVEERLPERGITKCSACVKCGDGLKRVVCASYNAELKLWTGWHGEKIGNEITHWMPLPEPPEEVQHNV